MKKPYLFILIVAAAALLAVARPAGPLQGRCVKQMEFRDFIERMKKSAGFELTIEGAPQKSFFTGKTYLYYETIAFFGQEDIRSTRRILYHTEKDFTLRHGDVAVTADFRLIRTCLAPSQERTYTKDGLKTPGSAAEKAILAILDEEQVPAVMISEFGLEAGKKYYARVKTESYHLPPDKPGGKSQRRENRVLLISNRPLPNDIKLTPLYQDWSY
jgi:hypothetical protein